MRESPKFLNLVKIHLPITGFVSILHRMSGVINIVLFVGLIYLYWLLPDSNEIKEIISMPSYRLVMWVAISAFLYHFLAGVRHIYMDFLHQHSLGFARYSSMAVLIVALLLAGWVGVSI